MKSGNKVVIAMSGGVDSSVAAALLKEAGFDVVGIMMKFWKDGQSSANRCCSVESEKLARLVAKKIGIPFYVLNTEKEFKKKVVDYFIKEYKSGKTPNPCVICNKEIKFGFLINKALALGADFVATGHYARTALDSKFFANARVPLCGKLASTGTLCPVIRKNLPSRLFTGKDTKKDQSYFLWQLNQKQLSHVLFPVGGYTKPEVRKLAKKFDLPTAETPESQEVCFISGETSEFLKKYLKPKAGNIVDVNNETIGKHTGLCFYTIGQRKGIALEQGPWYVVGKNLKNNTLVVSLGRSPTGEAKIPKDLLRKELVAKDVNWISGQEPKLPLNCEVRVRYKSNLAKAKIMAGEDSRVFSGRKKHGQAKVRVVFAKLQKSITAGQSAVFYTGKELLGGGVIE